MRFILEEIEKDDHKTILDDAKHDRNKFNVLTYLKKENNLPRIWAVDKLNKSYLYLVPEISRQEDCVCMYYFCIDGYVYELRSGSLFGNGIYCMDKLVSVDASQLEEKLKEAFLVFGKFGKGTEDNGVFGDSFSLSFL